MGFSGSCHPRGKKSGVGNMFMPALESTPAAYDPGMLAVVSYASTTLTCPTSACACTASMRATYMASMMHVYERTSGTVLGTSTLFTARNMSPATLR